LSLEEDADCGYDSVTLYDGSNDDSPELGRYCTDIPATITSSGSSLFVAFESDRSVNSGRFSLSWTFVSQGGGGQGWYCQNHWLTDSVKHFVMSTPQAMAGKQQP